MKKFLFASVVLFSSIGIAKAQLQQGNVLVGGQLSNISFGLGNQSNFNLSVTPRVGYFVQDNLALGGKVGLSYYTAKGQGNLFGYNVGAFGRYYFSPSEANSENLLKHGRFFVEAGAGVAGANGVAVGSNFNFGPGYAFFITPNVALETAVMYNGTFGTGAKAGLDINLGFQIHLPSSKVKQLKNSAQSL